MESRQRPIGADRSEDTRAPPDRRYLLLLGGFGSASRSALNALAGLVLYLRRTCGVDPRDVVEASYRFADGSPRPYQPLDTGQPIADSLAAVAQSLAWCESEMAPGGSLHLIGYSLGGALLLEAALRERRPSPVRSVTTLSSPINGTDVGFLGGILGMFDPVLASPAGQELCRRGGDPEWRRWIRDGVARLRRDGVRVSTLVAADDSVVTPEDGVVETPEDRARSILTCRAWESDGTTARVFGHGPILRDPAAWRRIAENVGLRTED